MAAMSSAKALLSFFLSFLVLSRVSLADQFGSSQTPWEGARRLGSQSECRIEKLSAQEPKRRVQSEAGVSEYYEESSEQFRCAGVSAVRHTSQPGALHLPTYSNAPSLVYVLKGRATIGMIIPGCPESYQSFQRQSESESESEKTRRESAGSHEQQQQQQQQKIRDQHQRILHIKEGEIATAPPGVVLWCYNSGDSPLETIHVTDTSNSANQLDRNHRQFLLAGSQKQQQQKSEQETSRSNILSGFDTESLANAMGISRELAEKLKGRNDQRGEIVQVKGRLEVLRPSRSESRSEEKEERRERDVVRSTNGIEQSFCFMKMKENIGKPDRADVYNPDSGWLTTLNSEKLPILRHLQLSAVRGHLRKNALLAPFWKVNAHSIMYVIRGSCRCQVVDYRGQAVFNGEVRQGQILVVPQNYAQLKQATSEDFDWVTIETNDNSITSPIVGKASALRGIPEEVLMNSYRISRQEARELKDNRGQEYGLFTPRSQQQQQQGRAEA